MSRSRYLVRGQLKDAKAGVLASTTGQTVFGTPPPPLPVSNDQTTMTYEQALTFAIPRGGIPLPADSTWKKRVDTAPDSDLYVDLAAGVYSHEVPQSAPQTLADEQFTGANGAAWSNLWAAPVANGSTFTIQGNRGRMVSAANYAAAQRNLAVPAREDFVLSFDLPFPPANSNIRIGGRIRDNVSPDDDKAGLFCNLSGVFNEVQLTDFAPGTGQFFPNRPVEARRTPLPTPGASNRLRGELIGQGSNAELRFWTPETSRPAAAQLTASNVSVAAGLLGIVAGAQGATTFDIDYVTVTGTTGLGKTLRAKFLRMMEENYGGVALNISAYNVVFHDLRRRGLPIKDVVFNRDYTYTPDTMYREDNGAHFRGVPYDPRVRPSIGTDRAIAIASDPPGGYPADGSDDMQLWEGWQLYFHTDTGFTDQNNQPYVPLRPLPPDRLDGPPEGISAVPVGGYFRAMEAGRMKSTKNSDRSGAFPNGKGSAATGLPNSLGVVALWEWKQIFEGYTDPNDPGMNVIATPPGTPVRADTGLRANGTPVIAHALNMAITDAKYGEHSWPATRSDGGDTSVDAIMEGLRWRFDPTVTSAQLAARTDENGRPITIMAKSIAETGKVFGGLITDRTYSAIIMTSEGTAFIESVSGFDPYGKYPTPGVGWTQGVGGFEILGGIPWDKIQFLKKDWDMVPPSATTRTTLKQPFTPTSPFNLGRATGATFEAANGPRTSVLQSWTADVWVEHGDFSHRLDGPTTTADPLATMTRPDGNQPPIQFRVKPTYLPMVGSDKHLHVMQPNGRTVVESWVTNKQSDVAFTSGRYAVVDYLGDGLGPQNGTRAYGGSSMSGIVRAWEVDPTHPWYTGRIDHAVTMMLPWNLLFWDPANTPEVNGPWSPDTGQPNGPSYGGSYGYGYHEGGVTTALQQPGWPVGRDRTGFMRTAGYVWPASEQDYDSRNQYTGPIPMGAYFSIPNSVDLTTVGFIPEMLLLARAYQDHGGYVCDTVGGHQAVVLATVEPSSTVGGKTAFGIPWAVKLIEKPTYYDQTRKLLALLRAVTNNTHATPNGGALGVPRRGVQLPSLVVS